MSDGLASSCESNRGLSERRSNRRECRQLFMTLVMAGSTAGVKLFSAKSSEHKFQPGNVKVLRIGAVRSSPLSKKVTSSNKLVTDTCCEPLKASVRLRFQLTRHPSTNSHVSSFGDFPLYIDHVPSRDQCLHVHCRPRRLILKYHAFVGATFRH